MTAATAQHPIYGDSLSESTKAMLGKHLTYTWSRLGSPERTVVGVCDRVERMDGVTIGNLGDGGERAQAFRLRIKPDDGGRAVWTHGMPDREHVVLPPAEPSVER